MNAKMKTPAQLACEKREWALVMESIQAARKVAPDRRNAR